MEENKQEEIKLDVNKRIQTVKTIPIGSFYVSKYGETIEFTREKLKEIEQNLNNPALFQPFVDKNHEYQESFADITGGELKEDGLYTNWKLNDKGIELIKNNSYRYISPTISEITDTNGKKYNNVLVAVTLTNIPALLGNLPKLQNQMEFSLQERLKILIPKQEDRTKMKNICLELGLNPEASELTVLNTLKSKMVELEAEKKKCVQMADDVMTLQKQKDEAIKQLIEIQEKLNALEKGAVEKEADEFTTELLECNLIHSKQADFWKAEFISNKAKTIKAFEGIERQKKEVISQSSNVISNVELSAQDIKRMKIAGLDEKSADDVSIYLKTKNML